MWMSRSDSGLPGNPYVPVSQSGIDAATNRMTSYTYDAAGNQLTVGGNSLQYDAESRQVSATSGGATATYSYDGAGLRVSQTASGNTTVYIYDAMGQLTTEVSPPSAPPALRARRAI